MVRKAMRVVIVCKSFQSVSSHTGLSISGINTIKVLRRAGIPANVVCIAQASELAGVLDRFPDTTHLVVSAPWIPTITLATLANQHSEVQWAVNCHSNTGFLQADTGAVQLIREAMDLSRNTHNFHLAGNSRRLTDWIRECYQIEAQYLPNLYFLDGLSCQPRPLYNGGTLRIGMFGAVRPLKNMMTGAAAALQIGADFREPLELYMCGGRTEGGGLTVLGSIRAMYAGLKSAKIMQHDWEPWPQFRRTVAHMHLLLQPSYSESFNVVSADGVAEGVTSVVSSAITWAPDHWKADVDDTLDIARVGAQLLRDPRGAKDGAKALRAYTADGLLSWQEWLNG